jgi:hypothetical protein
VEDTEDKEPLSTSPALAAPSRKRVRREKRVPPSELDKATEKIREGGKIVSLIGTPIKPDMDDKLALLIQDVMAFAKLRPSSRCCAT